MRRSAIGKVASVHSGFAFKSRDWKDSGVPVIKIKNVKDGFVSMEGCSFVDETVARSAAGYELLPGDILISMTGYIGEIARVRNEGRMLLNQRVGKFSVTAPEQLDRDYLFYCLRDPDLKTKFAAHAYGAAQPNISPTLIEQQEIPLPPLPMQRRIAGMLSAYDELIENSQRRIRILEAMARALYREWFVHFRFPGHENHPRVPSPHGEIPAGWEVKAVKDILSRRKAGTVYRGTDVVSEGEVPVLDQSTSELLGFHDNEADHIASPESPLAIFGDHTCKMQLLIEPFSVGPNVVPFSAKPEFSTAYVFYAVNSLVNTQEYKRHWGPLNAREVIVADDATASRFTTLVQPMLMEQEALRRVIHNLRSTRDLLLPRLLSGQLELEAA